MIIRIGNSHTTHVTHRIRIFDKVSEHVKVAKSVDIAVPELVVTTCNGSLWYNEFSEKSNKNSFKSGVANWACFGQSTCQKAVQKTKQATTEREHGVQKPMRLENS